MPHYSRVTRSDTNCIQYRVDNLQKSPRRSLSIKQPWTSRVRWVVCVDHDRQGFFFFFGSPYRYFIRAARQANKRYAVIAAGMSYHQSSEASEKSLPKRARPTRRKKCIAGSHLGRSRWMIHECDDDGHATDESRRKSNWITLSDYTRSYRARFNVHVSVWQGVVTVVA